MTTKTPLEHYLHNSQIKLPGEFRLQRGLMLHEPDGTGGYSNNDLNSTSNTDQSKKSENPDSSQSTNKDDYDSPWKEALDLVFKDFVALYIPDVYTLINWDKGYIALDGELQSMHANSKQGRKLVDKLMQVHLKDGTSAMLLIHIEVEHSINGAVQLKILGIRMLEYYMFLALKYPDIKIYSIAVVIDMSDSAAALLTDTNKLKASATFTSNSEDTANDSNTKAQASDHLVNTLPRFTLTASTNVLDCSLNFTLPIVNLKGWLDHEHTLETLANTNPFAVITLAQLAALKYKKDKAKRLQPKMALVRKLQSYGYTQSTIITLFRLIDWLVKLPEQSTIEFNQFLIIESKEQNVRYVTPFEQFLINRFKDDFVSQGELKGTVSGQAAMLLRQLTRKFTSVPDSIAERLENANQEQLESWSLNILDAKALDDVFKQ